MKYKIEIEFEHSDDLTTPEAQIAASELREQLAGIVVCEVFGQNVVVRGPMKDME